MSKVHTSMKCCNNFRHVFRAGYCDFQFIMYGIEPQFYNSGVYGWNCNLYADYSRDCIITTGYRNMRGSLIPSEIIRKYDAAARAIIDGHNFTQYAEMCAALEDNRNKFFSELGV